MQTDSDLPVKERTGGIQLEPHRDDQEKRKKKNDRGQAAAYIHLLDAETGNATHGVGVSSNITRASVRAVFSAMNRMGLGEKKTRLPGDF